MQAYSVNFPKTSACALSKVGQKFWLRYSGVSVLFAYPFHSGNCYVIETQVKCTKDKQVEEHTAFAFLHRKARELKHESLGCNLAKKVQYTRCWGHKNAKKVQKLLMNVTISTVVV